MSGECALKPVPEASDNWVRPAIALNTGACGAKTKAATSAHVGRGAAGAKSGTGIRSGGGESSRKCVPSLSSALVSSPESECVTLAITVTKLDI